MIARLRQATRRDDGASAVEFALLVPVLILIAFGIIAFGLILFSQISATHAAREAVRQIAVDDEAVATCADVLTYLSNKSGFTPQDLQVGTTGDAGPGERVTLTFEVPTSESAAGAFAGVTSLFPGGQILLPTSLTIEADARIEVTGAVAQGGCS